MADRKVFSVSVVTPEGPAYEGDAEMIIVPGAAGEIGVLARHAPLIATLKAGSTRVHPPGGEVLEYATGLFITDPVLQKQGAKIDYWKTGHSYMKRRTNEMGALAGFEKSGHFFFNKPFGRGYDDGLVSAIAICDMLDRAPGKSMADLKNALPKTWSSPTMSPHCADEAKYGVVDAVVKHFEGLQNKGAKIGGQSRQQVRRRALAAGGAGSLQARRELRLSRTLIEQVDVGGLGPAVL